MVSVVFCCLAVAIAACEAALYVEQALPFHNGSLATRYFDVGHQSDSNLNSMVFYPTVAGTYPVFFFIPGFRGMIPSNMHKDYLSGVASHGYVVVSTDHIDFDSVAAKTTHFTKRFEWMKTNLNGLLTSKSSGVKVDWNYIAMGSHSAGAEIIIAMMKQNRDNVKAAVFLEPMVTGLSTPITFHLPALMYGTELAEQGGFLLFPPCVFSQFDYKHVYDNWTPTKVMIESKGYGHCDILDKAGYNLCSTLHLCQMHRGVDLHVYQRYLQGITTGFLSANMLGRNDAMKYVIQKELSPIPLLQLQYKLK
ncbi:uncharacterized protein LOC135467255 [Liolophura sinensis]|uniref:uncharacterized protein LOC135467255 n=1 Tax=Liolophura sinensis TaxID=3198878 RepID=UPI00315952FE